MSFDIAMSKPHLRREMEANLKLICKARRSRDEVVDEAVRAYAEVFTKVETEVGKLDEALNKFMGAPDSGSGTVRETTAVLIGNCSCGQSLALKQTKNGKFMIGCRGYPNCKKTVWLDNVTDATTGEACPRCRTATLRLALPASDLPPGLVRGGIFHDCIFCHPDAKEAFNIRWSPAASVAPQQAATRARTPATDITRGPSIGAGSAGASRNPVSGRAGSAFGNNTAHNGGGFRDAGGYDGGHNDDSGLTCFCKEPVVRRAAGPSTQNSGREFLCCAKPKEEGCGFFGWADDEQGPQCACGVVTFQRIARASQRPFFACSGKNETKCDFFEWADGDGGGSGSAPASSSGSMLCNCNISAAQRTVAKEGPNKGRQFFCCSKRGDDKCDFFCWEDEANGDVGRGGGGGGGGRPGSGSMMCNCNLAASQRTVAKEGPNKGRKFFRCGKRGQDDNCDFFCWDEGDEGGLGGNGFGTGLSSGGGSTSGYSRGSSNARGRGGNSGGSGGGGGGGCYKCGRPGHWASQCPDGDGAGGSRGGRGRGGRGGGGSGGCYKCGQPGHWANNCPND